MVIWRFRKSLVRTGTVKSFNPNKAATVESQGIVFGCFWHSEVDLIEMSSSSIDFGCHGPFGGNCLLFLRSQGWGFIECPAGDVFLYKNDLKGLCVEQGQTVGA